MRPVCVFVGLATAVLGATWVETDWDEFRDGTFEHNLYVSHRDSGTVEFVPRFDLNNDAWIDLVCSDWTGPYLRVYFGDSSGFSAARRRIFPITYGGGSDAADLNCDGYADLIRPGWHSDPCIYWGSDSGPSPDNQTILSAHGAEATMTADLDNDGYLDIVFPGEDGPLVIYWGTASGYTSSQRTEIPIGYGMGFNSEIADLNRDGYLDIIVTCYNPSGEQPVIYFGAGRAYHIEWLQYRASSEYGPHGLTVADFDHNGWLDVVYTGFADITESYIYFGSAQGFSTSRRTIVAPGHCHGGSAAYDFDRDGWVDLLFFRGNGNYGDYSRPVIYYNCGTAPYFDDSRTQLVGNIPLRLSGGLIGDFNRDGNTDIYVACFESNTPSPMPSLVLWGPDWMTADTLECEVDHHSHPREPGNTYDRTYREDYLSSVFDADAVTHWQSVTWDDSSPGGSSVELSVRTGNTPSPDSTWSGWVDVTNGGPVPDSLDSRHIQYQATLKYQNPASLPMLFEVRVAYGSGLTHDVGATSIVAPAGTVDSGTVRVPRAVVRNFGTTGAVFPVTMRIGVGYSQSVSETLAAGIADTVSFPVWTATPTGVLPVTCFTGLTGDENPANDTIRDSVRVVGPPEHDVGATAILSPTGTVHTGDTVIPMARISNFGNTAERFFDVRFRIGTSYSRTATMVQILLPDSTVDLAFEPWVAASGNWAVSCSTMLPIDANRSNDKISSSVRAFEQSLQIEPDQSDRLEVGQGKTYQFHALIEGDTGGVVEVARPFVPAGWSLRLCDSTGTNELTDTDVDGVPDLGYVAPGVQRWFSLEVMTPSGLVGDTASLTKRTFVVAGHLGNDLMVADTALLNLTLVPGFSVHNFPNPFSIRTAFVIGLPGDGKVTLTVYTRAGERVCRVLDGESRAAGVQMVRWEAVNDHGQDVAPGTYEYVLDYLHQGTTDRIRKRLVVTRE